MSAVMDESLKLRIASIFIMLCASMGGMIIMIISDDYTDKIRTDDVDYIDNGHYGDKKIKELKSSYLFQVLCYLYIMHLTLI